MQRYVLPSALVLLLSWFPWNYSQEAKRRLFNFIWKSKYIYLLFCQTCSSLDSVFAALAWHLRIEKWGLLNFGIANPEERGDSTRMIVLICTHYLCSFWIFSKNVLYSLWKSALRFGLWNNCRINRFGFWDRIFLHWYDESMYVQ